MGRINQVNIKSRTYYFLNDMINIKNFNSDLLKIEKKVIEEHQYLLHWIHHNKKY